MDKLTKVFLVRMSLILILIALAFIYTQKSFFAFIGGFILASIIFSLIIYNNISTKKEVKKK